MEKKATENIQQIVRSTNKHKTSDIIDDVLFNICVEDVIDLIIQYACEPILPIDEAIKFSTTSKNAKYDDLVLFLNRSFCRAYISGILCIDYQSEFIDCCRQYDVATLLTMITEDTFGVLINFENNVAPDIRTYNNSYVINLIGIPCVVATYTNICGLYVCILIEVNIPINSTSNTKIFIDSFKDDSQYRLMTEPPFPKFMRVFGDLQADELDKFSKTITGENPFLFHGYSFKRWEITFDHFKKFTFYL